MEINKNTIITVEKKKRLYEYIRRFDHCRLYIIVYNKHRTVIVMGILYTYTNVIIEFRGGSDGDQLSD